MARNPDRRDAARGHRIKALREARGFTQVFLAHEIGAGERTLREWEQGDILTHGRALALADALGTTVSYIMRGDTNSVPDADATTTIRRVERLLEEHHRETSPLLRAIAGSIETLALETQRLRQAQAGAQAQGPAAAASPAKGESRTQANLALAPPAVD